MKGLCLLGSTGSIGTSTLDVVAAHPDRFRVHTLAAGRNVERLAEQVRRFSPSAVAVADRAAAEALAPHVPGTVRIEHGAEGLAAMVEVPGVDLVVSAVVGAAGLLPTWRAVSSGIDVALANKESLVVAGELMMRTAAARGARLLPVDSEHNALHQCLRGERTEEVRRLWLTASGGPFRKLSAAELSRVTRDQALDHPTWKMGPKITVDSATLMNKGLEVIEARWLFGLPADKIDVVVHPQSVIHSMVEFVDGSFKAQLGIPDMRHPIQYALTWPDRIGADLPPFDPVRAGRLEFEAPDLERFPCLGLAFAALRAGGAAPAVLNAANEIAVEAFLEERIGFPEIPRVLEHALERHGGSRAGSVEELLALDGNVRQTARRSVAERSPS